MCETFFMVTVSKNFSKNLQVADMIFNSLLIKSTKYNATYFKELLLNACEQIKVKLGACNKISFIK